MKKAFEEVIMVNRETMIDLMAALNDFDTRIEKHIEKYDNYDYKIEMLDGERGNYNARVIITKYENT